MCLSWISSLYHCYDSGQRPPQSHPLLPWLSKYLLSFDLISSSYWEGEISCGTGLKGISMAHCFQCPAKGIESLHKMSLGALSTTRTLHTNSRQMTALSCHRPCIGAPWVTPGNSTLQILHVCFDKKARFPSRGVLQELAK